jgi:hypothetical protein
MWCRDLRSAINVFFNVGRMRRRIPAYDHLGGDDLGATLAFGLGFLAIDRCMTAAISIEILSLVMIFCEGTCMVTVRKDTRTTC